MNGHEWVDLGLSVKWATCNVGASRPEEYGDYLAWGETFTKESYGEDNSWTFDKSLGDIGGDSCYDVATADWGSGWRLPTIDEFKELRDNCIWTWSTRNGVYGYEVKSKKNGNSIFLPATGCYYGDKEYHKGSSGYYWSSTPGAIGYACNLLFNSDNLRMGLDFRDVGQSVRPVAE